VSAFEHLVETILCQPGQEVAYLLSVVSLLLLCRRTYAAAAWFAPS